MCLSNGWVGEARGTYAVVRLAGGGSLTGHGAGPKGSSSVEAAEKRQSRSEAGDRMAGEEAEPALVTHAGEQSGLAAADGV